MTRANVDVRVTRARSHLIQDHPFFGSLVMRLIPVAWTGNNTMATDGKHLFYSTSFLDRESPETLLMGLAHEVLHCALGHHTRRGNRDHKRWNIACDHVVNLMLKKAGFKVPAWAYCDYQYSGLNAEQVYRLLEQAEQKQQEDNWPIGMNPDGTLNTPNEEDDDDGQQTDSPDGDDNSGEDETEASAEGSSPEAPTSGSSGDGLDGGALRAEGDDARDAPGTDNVGQNGQGGSAAETTPHPESHGDPGGLGEVLDAAPSHDQAALDEANQEWEVYTRQAVNVERRRGEGRMTAFIEELVEELNDPKVDWRAAMRRFIDPSSTKDFSWANPNKRYMSMGFYTPGFVTDGVNHVGFLVDSSGSISTDWLKQTGAEVQDALDNGAIDRVTVIMCDDRVHSVKEFTKGEVIDFTVLGRGGTRFSPAFDRLNQDAPDVSVAVYLTDLDCSDFGPTPPYPVLWAVYGDPRYYRNRTVPFGEVMPLE